MERLFTFTIAVVLTPSLSRRAEFGLVAGVAAHLHECSRVGLHGKELFAAVSRRTSIKMTLSYNV